MKLKDLPVPSFNEIPRDFVLIFFVYIYLFQPPLINKNIFIIIELVIFVFFVFHKKSFWNSFYKNLKIEFYFLIVIACYSIARDSLAGQEVYSFRFLAWGFQAFFFSYLIIYSQETINNNSFNLINILYWVSFIASIITFLLIISPKFDDFYKSIAKDGSYELYENMKIRYRAFGIAENLTFTYSFVLGFFSGYTILIFKRNWTLFIPLIFFIIGIFFNARIGFLPIIIFMLIGILSGEKRNIFYVFSLFTISVYLFFYFNPEILETLQTNKDWVFGFFFDLSDTFLGTDFSNSGQSTLKTLTSDFIVLPNNFFEWVIGSGESLFGRSDVQSSDVGYILQLKYGGLILVFLLFSLHLYVFYRLQKVIGMNHWFTIIFILSVLLLNLKGFLFAATPGGRILYFLYVLFIFQKRGKTIACKTIN